MIILLDVSKAMFKISPPFKSFLIRPLTIQELVIYAQHVRVMLFVYYLKYDVRLGF